MSLWLKWKAQFIEAEKPNMVAIKTRLLDQIQGDIFQAECNELAKKLNKLIHDVSFEGMSQELLNKIVEASNINLDSLGNIDFKRKYDSKQKANFALTSSELEAAWRQLKKASEGLTEEQKKIQLKNSESDLSKWQKIVNQLEGSLNNIRGQIFESYLNAIGETIKLYSKDMIESVATNEVDNLLKLLKSKMGEVIIQKGDELVQTEGADSQKVDIIIGDTYIKTIDSKKKVDVTIPSPFQDQQSWFISAKNYSKLRNIDLLSNGSILGLLSQGLTPQESKYFYNAFTIPSSNWTTKNIHHIKQIFAIQALSGQKANETKANVLVLSINSNKDPIRVVSIKSLINKIIKDKTQDSTFIFSPELNSLIPSGDTDARNELDIKKVKDYNISIALNRVVLYLSYLKQLT